MSSGVKVDPDCIEAFNNFKLGKKEAFLLFGFNENATKIIVLHKESKNSGVNDDLKVKSMRISREFRHNYNYERKILTNLCFF